MNEMKILPFLILLFAISLPSCGLQRTSSLNATKENATSKNQAMSNLPIFIVPLKDNVPNRKKPPAFNDLFMAVAEDKECLTLAKRLFWGVPVEVVAVNGEQAEDAVPAEQHEHLKKGPSFVYIRFRADSYPAESTEKVIVGRFSYRRLSRRLEDKVVPLNELSFESAFDDADDFEAVLLLCNDYLLRHDMDWVVVGQSPHTKDSLEKATFELEEMKKDHSERIDKFVQKYVNCGKHTN